MKHEATNAGCMCSHKAARYVARLTPSKRSHPFQCISKWNSTCRHRSQQCAAQPHQYHEQAWWAHSAYPLLHEKEDEENGGCVGHARDPCDSTWTAVDCWLMTALGAGVCLGRKRALGSGSGNDGPPTLPTSMPRRSVSRAKALRKA